MKLLQYTNGVYRTHPVHIPWFCRKLPELCLYRTFIREVFYSSRLSKRGSYNNMEWASSSYRVMLGLEKVGVRFEISGIEHLENLKSPCVIIGNHMSVLETVILPAILLPIINATFVVKQSLLDYPVFGHIMQYCDPIAVTRTQPRQDLIAVIEGGIERLGKGISIVVFPQTTRTVTFDTDQFSSIGAKLAQKADAPIVPLALCSAAWKNGKRLKDFGGIDPSLTVRFAFGPPIPVQSRGSDEHQKVIEYIRKNLTVWEKEDSMDYIKKEDD
ncbi:1-acyl-sn-glycerol-3-phosphate acyltransferase [bacterium]|nr:1-acyl-sn-glycerol-3-phosphate acyltransferase [bacterium]